MANDSFCSFQCCICYVDDRDEETRQNGMCKHCKERRSCMYRLEQELVSARLSRQDAIAKIEEDRKHIDNVGKPFANRLDLVKLSLHLREARVRAFCCG